MANYISSNENRFYAAVEQSYGAVAAVTAQHRFPAVKLTAKQQVEKINRKDKTGNRTFPGLPTGLRTQTSFDVRTYMTSWSQAGQEPGYGALFQSALGSAPQFYTGSAASAGSNAT